jgi:hypothetical protein
VKLSLTREIFYHFYAFLATPKASSKKSAALYSFIRALSSLEHNFLGAFTQITIFFPLLVPIEPHYACGCGSGASDPSAIENLLDSTPA